MWKIKNQPLKNIKIYIFAFQTGFKNITTNFKTSPLTERKKNEKIIHPH